MKRIGSYDPYFETWDIEHKDILRLIARGWIPCPELKEQMKRREGLSLDIPYGIHFDRENTTLILVI